MSFCTAPYSVEYTNGRHCVCINDVDRVKARIMCIDGADARELCSYLMKHHKKYVEYKLKCELELDQEIRDRMKTLPPGNQTLGQIIDLDQIFNN